MNMYLSFIYFTTVTPNETNIWERCISVEISSIVGTKFTPFTVMSIQKKTPQWSIATIATSNYKRVSSPVI